ncbi:MAG: hypothetical protein JWQ97_3852, partial [Phenylobacterium sp.]|nr:hypothetical protein [Phenylobacterium sp.]
MPAKPSDTPDHGPSGLAAPVGRGVAEDLQAIFPDTGETRPSVRRRLRLTGRSARRDEPTARSGERRAARIGAVVAAACVGVSAGALLAKLPQGSKPAPAAQLAILPAPDP